MSNANASFVYVPIECNDGFFLFKKENETHQISLATQSIRFNSLFI